MAKTFVPQDIHVLMNALVKQATGQQAITVVDANSFVSAGELVMSTGVENTLNSLSIIVGRTLMAVRPYNAKLKIINTLNSGLFTDRTRKISFYSKDAQVAGFENTNLFTNLAQGYTNGQNTPTDPKSTKSMWEQNRAIPLEMNFYGKDVWQDSITVYEVQLQRAFESEVNFSEFINGVLTEKGNDIESQKEAYNRLAILQKIGQTYDMRDKMSDSVINLTDEYNAEFNTAYTRDELLSTHLQSFLEFFVARFKIVSDYMTNRSAMYHWSPTKQVDGVNYTLLRHTPKEKQRLLLYSPLFTKAKAYVFPEIFNEQYLDMGTQYEGVTYWQSMTSPSAVNIIPGVVSDTGIQEAGDEVNLPYVVGLLYDVDGLMTDFQYENSATSPLEARKLYRNIWYSFSKNILCDPTENTILFVM